MKKILVLALAAFSLNVNANTLAKIHGHDDPNAPLVSYALNWLAPVKNKDQCYEIVESLTSIYKVIVDPRKDDFMAGDQMKYEIEQ